MGVAVFALGHIFCFSAFCALDRFRTRDLIPIGILCPVSLFAVLGTPYIQVVEPSMRGLLAHTVFHLALEEGNNSAAPGEQCSRGDSPWQSRA